jgi:DNA adenine methylase
MKLNREALLAEFSTVLHCEVTQKRAKFVYNNPDNYSDLAIAKAVFVLVAMSFAGDMSAGFAFAVDFKTARVRNKVNRLADAADKLRYATIYNRDALWLIDFYKDVLDAFYYVDPPYFNSNMGHYDGYTEADFVALMEALAKV